MLSATLLASRLPLESSSVRPFNGAARPAPAPTSPAALTRLSQGRDARPHRTDPPRPEARLPRPRRSASLAARARQSAWDRPAVGGPQDPPCFGHGNARGPIRDGTRRRRQNPIQRALCERQGHHRSADRWRFDVFCRHGKSRPNVEPTTPVLSRRARMPISSRPQAKSGMRMPGGDSALPSRFAGSTLEARVVWCARRNGFSRLRLSPIRQLSSVSFRQGDPGQGGWQGTASGSGPARRPWRWRSGRAPPDLGRSSSRSPGSPRSPLAASDAGVFADGGRKSGRRYRPTPIELNDRECR